MTTPDNWRQAAVQCQQFAQLLSRLEAPTVFIPATSTLNSAAHEQFRKASYDIPKCKSIKTPCGVETYRFYYELHATVDKSEFLKSSRIGRVVKVVIFEIIFQLSLLKIPKKVVK